MEIARDIFSIILFAISVYGWWSGRNKELTERTAEFVKVNLKLDQLCQSQTVIKDDMRELKKSTTEADKRILLLEQQVAAHEKRIEMLERK